MPLNLLITRHWRAEILHSFEREDNFPVSGGILARTGDRGRAVMLELQRGQFEHDERFHREIARLSIHARLNHMALHFCKYTGQFAKLVASKDDELRSRTIVDSFIICLCAANALNVDLSTVAKFENTDVHSCGFWLAERLYPSVKLDDNWLLGAYAIEAGKMARACEKVDHLESFPFRDMLTEAVAKLCQISLIAATINRIDIVSAVENRRKEIRLRNTFVGEMTSGYS